MKPVFAIALTFWMGLQSSAAFALEAIENVISEQLDAFNDRDIPKAYGYASPMIKRIFGGHENFAMMVERAFPMVWDNADKRFMSLREEAGAVFQKVFVRGDDGAAFILEYKMIETDAGWLIDGVSVLPAPDVSA